MLIRADWMRTAAALLLAWAGTIAPVAAQSVWAPGARMNVARAGHTATVLPDGRILVVGGHQDNNILASAELYNPVDGTWRLTASLKVPRHFHTATLLGDGRVLVIAGRTVADWATLCELYDPATESWASTGALNADEGHTATLLHDGRVLVAGGYRLPAPSAIYEPATGTWTTAGELGVPRLHHTATRLRDGRVLVVGGFETYNYPTDNGPLTLAEWYDPATDQWSPAAGQVEMYGHAATLLRDGRVLVAGGNAAPQIFDPAIRTWTATLPNDASYGPGAVLLPSGDVLLAGGSSGLLFSGAARDVVQRFEVVTGTWNRAGNLLTARAQHTLSKLLDGRILVAGGTANPRSTGALDSTELLAAAATSVATIGAEFTGAWYDPAQNGHGIFIEVLPENRFFATWLTFDPSGAQAWLVGLGTYGGDTATLTAVEQPGGGGWVPNLVPNHVVRNAWGTLVFTFTDCNHGRVAFSSPVAGFGRGSMELTRLTLPLGVTCP